MPLEQYSDQHYLTSSETFYNTKPFSWKREPVFSTLNPHIPSPTLKVLTRTLDKEITQSYQKSHSSDFYKNYVLLERLGRSSEKAKKFLFWPMKGSSSFATVECDMRVNDEHKYACKNDFQTKTNAALNFFLASGNLGRSQ